MSSKKFAQIFILLNFLKNTNSIAKQAVIIPTIE
jgi:hypothetical protein